MIKITSKEKFEIYLASTAASHDGKGRIPKQYSEIEENNFMYKIIVKNIRTEMEIQDFITEIKLEPNRGNSKIQSSKATFVLDELNLVEHGDKIDIFVRDIFENFEIKVLSGKAKIENSSLNNYKMLTLNISVMDGVENLYSKIVSEDIFMFDNYLANENDKTNSILYSILYKLGFEDEDIVIEDIRNSNDSLIRIPFMLFKADNRWIDELFTALNAVGATIAIDSYGKVTIKNGIEYRDATPVYEFNENNVLENFESVDTYPEKNGSKIIFDNYRYLENQIIFGLAEKIEVAIGMTPASNQKAMKIQYVSDLAKSYNLTKAEGYWYRGEDVTSIERVQLVEGIHYKFDELKSSGAVVKFFNPFPKKFYIDVFEISGIPLVKYEDNEYVFKDILVLEKNDENFYGSSKNKYIQEESLAAEVGKIIYLENCKKNTEYSFKSNFVPFLDIGDICNLNFLEKEELVRITSIEHLLGRERGCTSSIQVEKVIYLTEEEYKNSSLESLNVSTNFLELKNIKEEIKNVEDEFKEVETVINGKMGAKAWISEERPTSGMKDYDIWYKKSTNEFKTWMNGQWNPTAEADIMPSLKSLIATQTAQLEMGAVVEKNGKDAAEAYKRAGIFLMNNDEKFGSINGVVAEVTIDKNARILAKNANNLLEFNAKDPANPTLMTSKLLMGVYDASDEKHKNTAFQVGDESTGSYLKFEIAKGVQHVVDGKSVTEWIADVKADTVEAMGALQEIASDEKLTAGEKQRTKKEFEQLEIEYIKTLETSRDYFVPIPEIQKMVDGYNGLRNYLEPLLANLNLTSSIVGETFRSFFSNHYFNVQNILGLIQEKVKDAAVSAATGNAQQLINSLGGSLQNQIDSKIDTWHQEEDPALGWATDDLRKAHVGDLWYKASTTTTQRYRRWDDTRGVWEALHSSDTVARDLAKSKRRVFTNFPTPPYDAGDLWVEPHGSGEMKLCIRTKLANESYQESDFRLATKYTDDKIAKEALEKANKASTDATGAIGMTEDLAKDEKLTAMEKQQTLKEFEIIQAEFVQNKTIATSYQVDKTNYIAKYNELESYLAPLLSNLSVTSDITPYIFRAKFSDYYVEEIVLTKAIYAAVQTAAATTALSVDNSNRILDSDLASTELYWTDYKADLIHKKEGIDTKFGSNGALQFTKKTTATSWFGTPNFEFEDGTYTISFNFFTSSPTLKLRLRISGGYVELPNSPGVLTPPVGGPALLELDGTVQGFRKITHTFKNESTWGQFKSGQISFEIYSTTADTSFQIGSLKLEKYKQATPWSKSPYDGNAQVDKVDKKVEDFLKDGSLSEKEKASLKLDIDLLQTEKNSIVLSATEYSIPYTVLQDKFKTLTDWKDGILSQPGNYTGGMGDFRDALKIYSLEKESVLKKIEDKIKAMIINVDEKVDYYSSDGILTVAEKMVLKTDVELITIEKTKLEERAVIFGVSKLPSTSYSQLIHFYNNVLTQPGNYTGDTGNFRVNLKDYATWKEELVKAIDEKAKQLSDKAQTDATGSLGKIDDMASDNKITATEKISTKKEWDIIASEYTKNVDQAKVYGVDYGNYTVRYNNLANYLSPILQNLSTTTDIMGGIFRDTFKYYYDARLFLLNTISAKIKAAADAAQGTGNEALGNLNSGKLVISSDTIFNGDARFESVGDDESTVIQKGVITFKRFGAPLTVFRNTRYGSVWTNNIGAGLVEFTGMKQNLYILTSLKSFQTDKPVQGIFCSAELVDFAKNRWKFRLGGTQVFNNSTTHNKYTSEFTQNCLALTYRRLIATQGGGSNTQGKVLFRITPSLVESIEATVTIIYEDGLGGSTVIFHDSRYRVNAQVGAVWQPNGACNAVIQLRQNYIPIAQQLTTDSVTDKKIKISFALNKKIATVRGEQVNWGTVEEILQIDGTESIYRFESDIDVLTSIPADFKGSGEVQYMAVEQ
ncbi:MAG: hypothetical protein ACRC0G_16030 [Fusobacteriaceae bacterium]